MFLLKKAHKTTTLNNMFDQREGYQKVISILVHLAKIRYTNPTKAGS